MTSHWILGPGAIGRLLAHSLSPVTDTTLVGRRALPQQQHLTTPEDEERTQRLASVTTAALASHPLPAPGFIHITTKAMAAEAALASIAGVVAPTTPLVLWQNGFLAQPRITQTWPGPVLCATTTQGAYLTGDDGVVHAGRGHTLIGSLNNPHNELAAQLAQRLVAAGLSAEPVANIRVRLWHKLAINAAINPLVARYQIRNGQLRDRPFRPMVAELIDEIQAILAAENIAPPASGWQTLIWGVIENTANNRASMLQDILADRPTEHAAILGPLCDAATSHGVPAPQLNSLLAWLASR
ncbi:ketopantoate reductase family protein [Halomonas halocynthiae]|uniref:ketopantoate reductase family protein n=1 Tax=Halomonas halocynthiae TaxID=176290 RepID=UPI00041C7989|nr:2-dehydropantoate 2-reductase [Halomonas halocynthiae]